MSDHDYTDQDLLREIEESQRMHDEDYRRYNKVVATFEKVTRVEVLADGDHDCQDKLAALSDSSFALALVAADGSRRYIEVCGGNGGSYGVDASWPEPDTGE